MSDRFSIDIQFTATQTHRLLSSTFVFLTDSLFFGIVQEIFLTGVIFLSLALFEQEAELATEDAIFDLHCVQQRSVFLHISLVKMVK